MYAHLGALKLLKGQNRAPKIKRMPGVPQHLLQHSGIHNPVGLETRRFPQALA